MDNAIRIAITGPESTAKSTLTKQLAKHFKGIYYSEYARLYLEEKGSFKYSYDDVEKIARGQLHQYEQSKEYHGKYVFFDTWLIITKVWFDWVYRKQPPWLEEAILRNPIDLYLLCVPDLEWVPDPLREHGGDDRKQLFETYKRELTLLNANFIEISGRDDLRLKNAIDSILYFQKVLK